MIKVHILALCEHCKGEAYLLVGEAESYTSKRRTRYLPCLQGQGNSNPDKWIILAENDDILKKAKCPHKRTSFWGGFHFCAGIVWDDITKVCYVCRENQSAPNYGRKKAR